MAPSTTATTLTGKPGGGRAPERGSVILAFMGAVHWGLAMGRVRRGRGVPGARRHRPLGRGGVMSGACLSFYAAV
jgi:hypothetical protein